MDDTFLPTARESLTAARATPRRQAAVTAALDALERALALLDAARRPRPIPLVSPLTPPTTRLDMIPRQEHVKRALEVALVGTHTVTLIAEGDPGDAFALAGWLNAYQPDTARDIDLHNEARRPLLAYLDCGGRDPDSPYVFTSQRHERLTEAGIHHWFRQLKARATKPEWEIIAPVRFHDLRHDFAHRARAAGWSLEEVAYYLGHLTRKGTPPFRPPCVIPR